MHPLIEKAAAILSENNFEYAFCGGFAIDLFLGYESRRHSDIDVLAYWNDRNAIILHMQSLGFRVYEMLGEGKAHHITDILDQRCVKRNIFCLRDGCEMARLSPTEEGDGIVSVHFSPVGLRRLNFLEILFNDKADGCFLYARDHRIRREMDKVILYYRSGDRAIPYLAPEFCLLYKSTDTEREGYQQDFDRASAKMDGEQKEWLQNALERLYPEGHKWRK